MVDEKSLLGDKPEFDNLEKYLKPQLMTNHEDELIKDIAVKIPGNTTEEFCKNIILFMNKCVPMQGRTLKDETKFKRTASQILKSKYRNGCCESTTLFVALARAKNIPSMQILTFDIEDAKENATKGRSVMNGHFYVGVFDKEKNKWYLVDADQDKARKKEEIRIYRPLNLENRNIQNRYAFAYIEDYSGINLEGLKIDSSKNMGEIQKKAYLLCDKKYIIIKNNKER